MWVVGIDENGLGPRLGALVVTSVTLEVDRYERARMAQLGRSVGIDDSKVTSAFGRMADAEGLALALIERLTGKCPTDADDVLRALAFEGIEALRAPCPASTAAQCWRSAVSVPAFGGDLKEGYRRLDRLARRGIAIGRCRMAIACPRVFNKGLDELGSKVCVDLGLFERLLLDARRFVSTDVSAFCGMVGGIRNYREYFQHLDASATEVVAESRRMSHYRIPALGDVCFEVDADGRHLPVALASMVGKYVRELTMERQNQFYLGHDPLLPRPSGYRDPVTARFIAESASLRKRLNIDPLCFERTR